MGDNGFKHFFRPGYGGFDELVINKLDALSGNGKTPSELKICVAYQKPSGEIIKYVPRQEAIRKQISPIYESMPAWKEDLSKISSFYDLPNEAKHYLARMVNSIIESAYPQGVKNVTLPKVRFVGVGPNPGQIISDIPDTIDLINKF